MASNPRESQRSTFYVIAIPVHLLIDPKLISDNAKSLPIFWGHGEEDPLVRLDLAIRSKEFLETQLSIKDASETGAVGLSFNTYANMGHSAEMQELDDLKNWLKKVVPNL